MTLVSTFTTRQQTDRTGAWLATMAILFAVALGGTRFGIGHTSFDYMAQARGLLEGDGLDLLTTTQPPFYTLIWLALLQMPDPLRLGFVLSLLSQGLTVWCGYTLLVRHAALPAAALGAALMAINGALAGSAVYVWVETPFTAALMAGWLAFDRIADRPRDRRTIGLIAVAALLACLPLYLRYAAAPVLAVMIGFSLWALVVHRRWDLGLYAGLILLFAAPLPILNWIIAGAPAGHPIGVDPGESFLSALSVLARELGSAFLYAAPPVHEAPLFNLTNADGAAMRLPIFATLIGAMALSGPAVIALARKRPALLRIGLAVPAYILFYALIASHTRIDQLSLRFVLPILPFVIVGWTMAAMHFRQEAALLLAGIVAGFALVGGMQALEPDRYGYSPVTVSRLARTLPAGATVLTNAFGRQLGAFAPQFRLVPLPYDDPFNGGFSQAYGIQPWSKAEFDDAMAREHVDALAIFLGPHGDDPYLDLGAYGPGIAALLSDGRSGAAIERLPDGIIVTFPNARP